MARAQPRRRAEPRAASPRRRRAPEPGSRESLKAAAAEVERAKPEMIRAARKDPAVFNQFVLRDEQSGQPIYLADVHAEWQDILTKHRRAVIWSATELGKSSQVSIGRALWEIGQNPRIRILILTEARSLGEKIIDSIKSYITTSVEFAAVFPNVRRGNRWAMSRIRVSMQARPKDFTVEAVGKGGRILGGRYDLIIIDDYLSATNTYNDHQRTAGYSWLKSTIEGRKAKGARLWFIGNAWHVRDAMHLYSKEPGTFAAKYPVLGPDGQTRWELVWPMERYLEELAIRGPVEGPRSLNCIPANDNTQWFPIRDIIPALSRGDGLSLHLGGLAHLLPGWATITAIDLGVKTHEAADDTAIITITVDPKGHRRIIAIESGKWRGSEVIDRAIDHHRRYHSVIWVETNAAQDFLKQWMNERAVDVPTRSFITTGRNRTHPTFGIQSIAAGMAQGAWAIPNIGGSSIDSATADALIAVKLHPQIRKLIEQMIAFSPDEHTGDLLQALWIADTGARALTTRVESGKKPRGM